MKSAICNLPSVLAPALALLICTSVGCHSAIREQADVSATDDWTQSYDLDEQGEVVIDNRNGAVEVDGVAAGSRVEVRATRVVRAKNEQTARDLLPKIVIAEDVSPTRISIRTKGIEGILMGVTFEVAYHLKVPAGAKLRISASNGAVTITNIEGQVTVFANNGTVKGQNLRGGVDARSVNGDVSADIAALGVDAVSLRTVNGSIVLTLPRDAKANLTASSRNGTIDTGDLVFESTQEPERGRSPRLRGRINGGGTPIDVQTNNGPVSISTRPLATTQD